MCVCVCVCVYIYSFSYCPIGFYKILNMVSCAAQYTQEILCLYLNLVIVSELKDYTM